MFFPINIATDIAKKEEKNAKLLAEVEQLNKEIAELKAKENA